MFSVVLMMFSDELRRSTDVLRCYQIFPNDLRIRDYHFSFETSQFRDFSHCFEGFDFGEIGLGKKVRYRFWKIWSRKKSWLRFRKKVTVSENLVSKKVSVLVSVHLV